MNSLEQVVSQTNSIPVSFAMGQSYANLGDALSPIMVSLLAGKNVLHSAMKNDDVRISAVGTIAHGMHGGDVHVWGSGTSRYANPNARPEDKRPFVPSQAARFFVHATRGPITREILQDCHWRNAPAYGDPVWLLPAFYQPKIEKKWDLGVVVHLSDLAERSVDCRVKPEHLRYDIPADLKGSIRLINTVTEPTVPALKARLDEILSCRRLVSTSLHGMVFAESYGIPCAYFGTRGQKNGLETLNLRDHDVVDLRIADLYLGLGKRQLTIYSQKRRDATDWNDLIKCIDTAWTPVDFDTSALIDAFPLPAAPLRADTGQTIFDHAVIRNTPVQHKHAGGHTAKWRNFLRRAIRGRHLAGSDSRT